MSSDLAKLLPGVLADVAQAIGVEAALNLSAAWPGVRIKVPQAMSAEHPIAVHVGLEAATKLARRWGGDYLVVPKATKYHRELLKQRALEQLAAGRPASELAVEFGVHQWTLYRWSSEKQAEKQQTLL